MKKIGVLLIQLGTPDSPKTRDVRRYLSEFLNDPRVIDLPWLGRKLLVNGLIVPFRAPKSAKIYKDLWNFGNGTSPLITHSESLKKKLQEKFKTENVTVHLAMRYQNPAMYDVMEEMRKEEYDIIVLLPLFPQYASATTGSAIALSMDIISKWWVTPEVICLNQFWDNEGYLDSIIENAKQFEMDEYDHFLFSYHGLPERQVEKVHLDGMDCESLGCKTELNEHNQFCYQATCFATTRKLVEKLNIPKGKYTVAFQSRLDKKWLTPFADKVVVELAKNGSKKILAFSPSFVADCLETVIEIGDEYQAVFGANGGEKIQLVPSSNDNDKFVGGLEQMIREKLK